jgi:hypothetical protein
VPCAVEFDRIPQHRQVNVRGARKGIGYVPRTGEPGYAFEFKPVR